MCVGGGCDPLGSIPGGATIDGSRNLYFHIGASPFVSYNVEMACIGAGAVVNTNRRDVADALAGIWQTTIEGATGVRRKSCGLDLDRCTPAGATIRGFGNPEGSSRPAAVAGG